MTTALAFRPLNETTSQEAPLPTEPVTPGNYGLVYDPVQKALIYAPSTDHHAGGAAWAWDGAAWKPFAEKTARGSSIAQPWRAVWDAKRKAVVVWSWDYTPGPLGVVIQGGAKAPVLLSASKEASAEGKGTLELLTGDLPIKADDTSWRKCAAMFGYDIGRGVTVCLNEAGLWELDGARWTRRDAALDGLPKQVDGSRMANGFGSFYDAKYERVVFWAHDREDDVLVLLAWDGTTLSRLDVGGLPDDLAGWRGGFSVGDHPEHGVVVLSGMGDAQLFAMKGKEGGFKPVPSVAGDGDGDGAPKEFSLAMLAFDVSRGELMLGPQHTKTKEHRFFVRGKTGWRAFGRAVEKSELGEHRNFFVVAGGVAYAVSTRGTVTRWDEGKQRWTTALGGSATEKLFEGTVQIAVCGWNDRVHAVSNDGAVFRLDGGDAAESAAGNSAGLHWTKVSAKSKDFGAVRWPLFAFDEARGLLVVWGDSKASRGRKDDTFVFDGKAWSKAKKGKEKPESLDFKDSDPFTMFYDPGARAVVRLSDKQVGVFDGKTWTHTPHRSAKLAVAWEQVVCVIPGKTDVLLVKRHMGEREVVLLRRGKDGYVLKKVATFEAVHQRGPHDTGGNASFDVGWFDPKTARFIAHLPEDASMNFALDLGALFEK